MLARILICAVMTASSALALADTLKSESDLRPFVESIMKEVAANDLQKAFEIMQPLSAISGAEFQSVALKSRAQREQYGARYGNPVGYEFIEQTKVGESLVHFVFIEKTEKHVLPWNFYFYKSPKGWALNSFNWNDQLQSVFNVKQ